MKNGKIARGSSQGKHSLGDYAKAKTAWDEFRASFSLLRSCGQLSTSRARCDCWALHFPLEGSAEVSDCRALQFCDSVHKLNICVTDGSC
eukprot:s3118_g5.t1